MILWLFMIMALEKQFVVLPWQSNRQIQLTYQRVAVYSTAYCQPSRHALYSFVWGYWEFMPLARSKIGEGTGTRRLANVGVKKSVWMSVKNGELFEEALNGVKRCKFSPFSERTPILAGICAAAKRISFGSFSLCNRKENEQLFSHKKSNLVKK